MLTSTQKFVRFCAGLSIALAVSWGPLSEALRVVEVSERGERTVRVELAQNYAPSRSKSAQKNSANPSKSESKTERILKAAPDVLELARAIHFELCSAPLAPSIADFIGSAEARHAAYAPRIADAPDIDSQPARGPPAI
ncbi:MAG TPA: hypothetical protein VKX17_19940 [Planctomycetota bacterium]|nr:hypothetical protein [Planctomycetota bacterium]